jgi:hypothetical protein
MEIIFNRQVRCVTKGIFRTAVDRDNDGVVVNAFYRHSGIKTYLKDGRRSGSRPSSTTPTTSASCAAWNTSPN